MRVLDEFKNGNLKLSVEVNFNSDVDYLLYDFGLLTLQSNGHSLILDSCDWKYDKENYLIHINFEYDEEIISERSNSDLTITDLYDLEKGILYIGCEYEETPDYMTLFVKYNDSTKAIDIEID